jgi:hypothetical protein
MPVGNLTKERRKKLQAEVLRLLKRYGNHRGGYDWNAWAKKHDVTPRTVSRWRKTLWDAEIAARYAKRTRKRRSKIKKRADAEDEAQVLESEVNTLATASTSIPIGPGSLGVDVVTLATRLEDCAARADKLLTWAERENGEIRSPKIYYQAVRLKLQVAEAVPRVLGFLWDVHQTERIVRLMFDRIAKEEPEVAHRLIESIKDANRTMGIFL